jgi:hypothetical protein
MVFNLYFLSLSKLVQSVPQGKALAFLDFYSLYLQLHDFRVVEHRLYESCSTGIMSEAIVRAWSGERGAGILRAGSRNYCQNFINIGILLKIEILMTDFFKNSIFGENYDLLLWVQKNLLLSEIEESTYEREGELKIKLEKERVRGTQKRDGELLKLKK